MKDKIKDNWLLFIQIFGLVIFAGSIWSRVSGKPYFTEPSIVILALTGIALMLAPYLAEFNLPGGIGFKLRNELKEVRETQLIGEVIFNRDDQAQNLFWVDPHGKKRLLPNKDTASLFMTGKGYIGISEDEFNKLKSGKNVEPLKKESFKCRNNRDVFAILDEKVFYLSSLSMPYKYGWSKVEEMGVMTDDDFKKDIYR